MAERPKSELDVFCRGCGAKPGEKCRVMPNRTLLRRRIRQGDPIEKCWAKVLPYFHTMRSRDFRKAATEWNKLDDWEKRYPAA